MYSLPVAASSPRAPGRQGQGPAAAPLSAQARAEARRPKPGHRGPSFFRHSSALSFGGAGEMNLSPSRGDSRETAREKIAIENYCIFIYFPFAKTPLAWDLRHVRDGQAHISHSVGRACPRPSHSKERAEAEAARANVGMARAGPSRSTPTAAAAAARGSAGFALGASLLIPRVWCARHCLCILIAA